MSADIEPYEMHYFASAVWRIARSESDCVHDAVAHVILNRMHAAGCSNSRSPCLGDGALLAASRGVMREVCRLGDAAPTMTPAFADPSYCRAFAAACLAWAGERPDPADGATHFHRHDELPAWARALQPTALIGSFFFYRREPGRPGHNGAHP